MTIDSGSKKIFNLDELETAFRRIRKEIKKYIPEEIITQCIFLLTKEDATSTENIIQNKPWELLLLIKWTFLHGDYHSPKRRRLSLEGFNYLRKLIYDLSGKMRLPSQYENVFLFLRNIAFQQFWIQEAFYAMRISRQSLLFGHLGKNHVLQETFKNATNVSINEFLELSIALLTITFRNDPKFTDEWFSTLQKEYPEGTINRFLNCLTKDIDGIKAYLKNERDTTNIAYEFYEKSPLKRYPLLKTNDGYLYYSPNLLFDAIENFIYDTLRLQDPHGFMDKFGNMFEKYVEKGIIYSELPYLTEAALEKHSNGKKIIDFVIISDDINILVDAKGVEMNYLGKVSHLSEVIRDKTKVSVVKGIRQAYDTVNFLKNTENINGIKIGKGSTYLLIVTFKDLYVGNGKDYQNYIAKSTFDMIEQEYGEKLIPPQNMYFISIDDLDQFFYCIKYGINAKDILERAVIADNSPETMKFIFRQHLVELSPDITKTPQYLEEEFMSLSAILQSKLMKK